MTDETSTEPVQVTVGLPVYNGQRYLSEAIASLLAQTFEDFELLLSDNASSDATEAICREAAARDERVRYIRNATNLGAAGNYNQVVRLARGRYFKWAAHDDLCAREYLERCVAVLDADPGVVVCYPRTRIIDEEGREISDYRDDLHLDSAVPSRRFERVMFRDEGECNAVFGLIRLDALRRTGVIGNYPASDMILLAELSLHGRFHEIAEPLFLRRDHPSTSIRANVSASERAAWFDPRKRGRTQLPHWRWGWEYTRAVARAAAAAKLPASVSGRCYVLLGRWLRWNRGRLTRELGRAVAHGFR